MVVEGRDLSAAAKLTRYICNVLLERRNVTHGDAATATKKDATASSKENKFVKANETPRNNELATASSRERARFEGKQNSAVALTRWYAFQREVHRTIRGKNGNKI